MKLFLCTNVRLGADCTDNLSVPLAREWAHGRNNKFEELPGLAYRSGAGYLVLEGSLFGAKHVPESLISTLFDEVRRTDRLETAACLDAKEYQRILTRSDVPANFHPLCFEKNDVWSDGNIEIEVRPDGVSVRQKSGSSALEIHREGETFFAGEQRLPDFEPVGFEDAQRGPFGYSLIDMDENGSRLSSVEGTVYFYEKAEARISPEDSKADMMRKIDNAVSRMDSRTIVRLFMTGETPFGKAVDRAEVKEHLQNKVFYAEVYDNTSMHVDTKALEHDISLQSEFVRVAMQDYSLSEAERSRLISCGWNALNGREVPKE